MITFFYSSLSCQIKFPFLNEHNYQRISIKKNFINQTQFFFVKKIHLKLILCLNIVIPFITNMICKKFEISIIDQFFNNFWCSIQKRCRVKFYFLNEHNFLTISVNFFYKLSITAFLHVYMKKKIPQFQEELFFRCRHVK